MTLPTEQLSPPSWTWRYLNSVHLLRSVLLWKSWIIQHLYIDFYYLVWWCTSVYSQFYQHIKPGTDSLSYCLCSSPLWQLSACDRLSFHFIPCFCKHISHLIMWWNCSRVAGECKLSVIIFVLSKKYCLCLEAFVAHLLIWMKLLNIIIMHFFVHWIFVINALKYITHHQASPIKKKTHKHMLTWGSNN